MHRNGTIIRLTIFIKLNLRGLLLKCVKKKYCPLQVSMPEPLNGECTTLKGIFSKPINYCKDAEPPQFLSNPGQHCFQVLQQHLSNDDLIAVDFQRGVTFVPLHLDEDVGAGSGGPCGKQECVGLRRRDQQDVGDLIHSTAHRLSVATRRRQGYCRRVLVHASEFTCRHRRHNQCHETITTIDYARRNTTTIV